VTRWTPGRSFLLAIALAFATALPSAASADTLLFSGTSANNLDLGTVTLEVWSDADGYLGYLTWDNSTLTNTNVDYILAASLKITSASSVGSSLVDAPGDPTTDWTFFTNTGAGNTCGTGSSGSVCASLDGATSLTVVSAGPYQWVFDIDVDSLIPSSEFSSQINFHQTRGNGTPNISTTFSQVPEPMTIALFAVGGGATLARRLRHRRT